MVYIFPKQAVEKQIVDAISTTKGDVFLTDLLANSEKDINVSDERFDELRIILNFVGIPYKVVIGVPDVINASNLINERDRAKLIPYTEYKKTFSKKELDVNEDNLSDISAAELSSGEFK